MPMGPVEKMETRQLAAGEGSTWPGGSGMPGCRTGSCSLGTKAKSCNALLCHQCNRACAWRGTDSWRVRWAGIHLWRANVLVSLGYTSHAVADRTKATPASPSSVCEFWWAWSTTVLRSGLAFARTYASDWLEPTSTFLTMRTMWSLRWRQGPRAVAGPGLPVIRAVARHAR